MLLETFKALADETRLRLIAILEHGEFTVQELMEILEMGQSRISRHLKILLDCRVVDVKREGTWAYYRLEPTNEMFLDQLPLVKKHFKTLPAYSKDTDTVFSLLAKRRQRSQLFFEQHAQRWDQIADDFIPTPDYLGALVSSIGNPGIVAEIGFGTGNLLNILASRAEKVIGIDRSPAMLEVARERIQKQSRNNVDLRLGEMEHLPLESGTIDVVILSMVLHHAAAPDKVIREASRVLVPGGLLAIIDLERHESEWTREKLADQWLGFTCEELKGWLARCDFTVQGCNIIKGSDTEFPVLHVVSNYKVSNAST